MKAPISPRIKKILRNSQERKELLKVIRTARDNLSNGVSVRIGDKNYIIKKLFV